jgi:hypothetical protein
MADDWRLREWVPPAASPPTTYGHGTARPAPPMYPGMPTFERFAPSTPLTDPHIDQVGRPRFTVPQPPQIDPRRLVAPGAVPGPVASVIQLLRMRPSGPAHRPPTMPPVPRWSAIPALPPHVPALPPRPMPPAPTTPGLTP